MAYGTNEPGFVADLRSAFDVWRVHPLLPIVTVVVTALGTLNTAGGSANPVLTVLGLPFGLFLLGFVGTTRVWYVRAWRGESMPLREVWLISWQFLGRMFRLALLGAIPMVAIALLVFPLLHPVGDA